MCLDSDVTTSDVSATMFMWVSHWSKMVYIFNMSNRGTCCRSVGLLLSFFTFSKKKERLNSFDVLGNKFMDGRENKVSSKLCSVFFL